MNKNLLYKNSDLIYRLVQSAAGSSNAYVGTGVTTASVTGSVLAATNNTSGLSLLIPSWLTTAGGGEWSVSTKTGSDIQISTGSTNTIYYANFLTTAQSPGAYLTTAAQSAHTHDYQSTGAYLTTAMQSASSSVFAKTGITTASTSGSVLVGTNNTDGLSLGVPAWLTVAPAGGMGLNTAVTNLAMTANSSGLSISIPAYLTTAAVSDHTHSNLYQSTGAYLTTAMASNAGSNFVGLATTGVTGASATINSSQLQLNIPNGSLYYSDGSGVSWGSATNGISTTITASVATNYLTTAAASNHTHSDLYLPLGNSTQWATGTLSSALMPLAYSSGFQTATLATKFLTTAAQSTQTLALSISGNTGTTGSSNIAAGGFVLAGGSNITISQSNNSISFHGATANGPASINFSDIAGFSWGISTSGSSTTVYLITA